MLIPAFVVLSLGAGIGYAAWQQLDSGRVDDNNAILDSLPSYPGSREIQRLTQTSAGEDDAFVRKYDANGTELWKVKR